MNRLSIEITEVIIKQAPKGVKQPVVHLEATLTVDDKQIKLKYSDDIVAYSNTREGDSSFLAKNTQKYIKNLLKVYVAGLITQSLITVEIPFDECESNECKLEE